MTRDEILNEPAGERMDRWVAERVMGWEIIRSTRYGVSYAVWADKSGRERFVDSWNPSTSIADAFEALEHWRSKSPRRDFSLVSPDAVESEWNVHIWDGECHATCDFGATLPFAICRALLLAAGKEEA